MPGSGEDVTKLFRSLSPDDFNAQASANAAAREAEQRWPLLQASAPKKFDLPPELSDQEKQRWSQQKKLTVEHRKPALSLPTSNDKMALSLDKMAGRKVKEAPTHHETAFMKPDPIQPVTPVKPKQNGFFSSAKVAVQEEKTDNSLGGIFRRLAGGKAADEAPVAAKPSLFGRLGRR